MKTPRGAALVALVAKAVEYCYFRPGEIAAISTAAWQIRKTVSLNLPVEMPTRKKTGEGEHIE